MATGRTMGLWSFVILTAALALPAPGQNTGGAGGRDPAQFRQRMLDRVKELLGASDADFAALGPKIEKVFQLQRDAGGGRMMFGRGGRTGGDRGGDAAAPSAGEPPQSDVQQKQSDLQATLENKDAKPEEIKAKLDALRAAKAQAKEELVKAQADLKSVLSVREEAVLVEMGILE